MPGLHICYLPCTDALLWTTTSLLPCLSLFFWSHSGAWFPPFSRKDLFLPTTSPRISLSAQSWLEDFCPLPCCRVKMCSPSPDMWIMIFQSRAIPDHFQSVSWSEAKCSFWIIHSMVVTLNKGLIAFSVLSCYNVLSSEPWDPLC